MGVYFFKFFITCIWLFENPESEKWALYCLFRVWDPKRQAAIEINYIRAMLSITSSFFPSDP